MPEITISYWGSPKISALFLQSLLDSDKVSVAYVVSQHDKPRSHRGQTLAPTDVKALALKNHIPVFTPRSIKKEKEKFLAEVAPYPVDFHLIFAYGKIIPDEIIDSAPLGALNYHASLLPAYRGSSPIEHALFDDLKKTGWSLQRITPELDAGDVYYQTEVDIKWEDTARELAENLTRQLMETGISPLLQYKQGKLTPVKQNPDQVTHCGKLTTGMTRVDWNKSSTELRNLYRGFAARGGLHTMFGNRKVKLKVDLTQPPASLITEERNGLVPGQVSRIEKDTIWIACGNKTVLPLSELQPEGKKGMKPSDFVNGYRLDLLSRFI